MKKITIIDGNSLLFRSYYATAYPGLEIMRGPDGTPTNAIFAFSNMINKIINDIKPGESLFVAFDAGKKTFRNDLLDTYKANRKPVPEDLVVQFPIVREFLKCLGIFQFEEMGFEGDDIAGTIATLSKQAGYDVHVYTSDRDFLQLVDNNVSVHILKKGLSDVAIMTPELVKETYGFEPIKIIDYKGLRGDSSDNLPGIPGIGEKTAVKLIEQYGSFDEIIAHADEISGKIGEAIKQNAKLGQISRDLAIIKTNVALPFSIDQLVYEGYDFNCINNFCQKYGLKTFINKVSSKWKKKDQYKDDLEIIQINSIKDIEIPNTIGIAIDLIDDDYTRGEISGLSLYINGKDYYISFPDVKKDKFLFEVLKNDKILKKCFDYKSIKVALAMNDIELNGLSFDLLLASYLIDTSSNLTPEFVFSSYGVTLDETESISLFSSGNLKKSSKVAHFSYILENQIVDELKKIDALNLYHELELPLSNALAKMEIEGFPIDSKMLDKFGEEYTTKIKDLEKEIYELAGEEFNVASPKQLADILFNKLGLKSNKKLSTSVEVLKELKSEHPIIGKILEYRKYFKLQTTYIDGLKSHIYPDNKIHAKFNQAITATGRLSSSDPNLQNISVRDEDGKQIRQAFYYDDENIEILSLDYSQIELRVLASLSNCQALINIFNKGEDIHAVTAKHLFNLSEQPTSLQRRKAKTVNFGVVYGISDWGLADQLDISVKEARTFINSFYETFPEIKNFFEDIITKTTNDGYVSTLLGRRRYLRELHDANYQVREFAKRAATNAPIQGTAADLIKKAMIDVDKAIEEQGLKSKMVLQIHDELIFKAYKDEKDILYNLVKNIMENALKLSVPLEVDGGFGKDWYSCK